MVNETKWVLVDADALFALSVQADDNHHKAVKIYQKLVSSGVSLACSNTSLYEVLTVLSMKLGSDQAIDFLQRGRKGLLLQRVDKKIQSLAEEIFTKQTSKNISFFDCINMAILELHGKKQIFSFDIDYKKNGYLRIEVDASFLPQG